MGTSYCKTKDKVHEVTILPCMKQQGRVTVLVARKVLQVVWYWRQKKNVKRRTK